MKNRWFQTNLSKSFSASKSEKKIYGNTSISPCYFEKMTGRGVFRFVTEVNLEKIGFCSFFVCCNNILIFARSKRDLVHKKVLSLVGTNSIAT